MLLPYSARLRAAGVQIVLASLSPRRKELMGLLLPPAPRSAAEASAAGAASAAASSSSPAASAPLPVPFACVPSTFAEDLSHALYPTAASYACATSLAKAREVWARVGAHSDLLIAADTVVTLDGKILEKPACECTPPRGEARSKLVHLSTIGWSHSTPLLLFCALSALQLTMAPSRCCDHSAADRTSSPRESR